MRESGLFGSFIYGTRTNWPDYLTKNGYTYRFIADHLGSPRLVNDTASNWIVQRMGYDSFGNVTNDTNLGFQPFGFAGGLYDRDTGMVRFGARDYDPVVGRWTAKDSIGFGGLSLNLFACSYADPINYVDTNGQVHFPVVTGLVNADFSVAVTACSADCKTNFGDYVTSAAIGFGVGFVATMSTGEKWKSCQIFGEQLILDI